MPPAALVDIVRKGLQYTEAEICIGEVSWLTLTFELVFGGIEFRLILLDV